MHVGHLFNCSCSRSNELENAMLGQKNNYDDQYDNNKYKNEDSSNY